MHNFEYVQQYNFIYYIHMFRSLLLPSPWWYAVRIQAMHINDYVKMSQKMSKILFNLFQWASYKSIIKPFKTFIKT